MSKELDECEKLLFETQTEKISYNKICSNFKKLKKEIQNTKKKTKLLKTKLQNLENIKNNITTDDANKQIDAEKEKIQNEIVGLRAVFGKMDDELSLYTQTEKKRLKAVHDLRIYLQRKSVDWSKKQLIENIEKDNRVWEVMDQIASM